MYQKPIKFCLVGNSPYASRVASLFRSAGVSVSGGNYKSMKSGLRYASKIGVEAALIIGQKEEETQTVTIRWLINGKQESIRLADVNRWLVGGWRNKLYTYLASLVEHYSLDLFR